MVIQLKFTIFFSSNIFVFRVYGYTYICVCVCVLLHHQRTLPKVPVMPISASAAQILLDRLDGDEVISFLLYVYLSVKFSLSSKRFKGS